MYRLSIQKINMQTKKINKLIMEKGDLAEINE